MRALVWCALVLLGTSGARAELPAPSPVSRAELRGEMLEKLARVRGLLKSRHLAGVLISQIRNFSWLTAGLSDNHIVITSETGPGTLLVMADGRRFLLASQSELPQLSEEGLTELGFTPRGWSWYEDKGPTDRKHALVRELAAGGTIASDTPFYDAPVIDGELAGLRFPLTATEVAKYRWLGRNSAEAVVETCDKLAPGMSEREIEALTADALMRRGIRPTVLLIGTDQRIYRYRHAPPSDARLAHYGMVNICARRWGLVVAMTRFVHFGPVPAELAHKVADAAQVNAALLAHSRPGVTGAELMRHAQDAYARVGWPGEWKLHHQGGPIGYGEREWVIWPGATERLTDGMAFAYNPTIQGAKIEDTWLSWNGRWENLTATPGWPTVMGRAEGLAFPAPAIRERR